MSAADPFTRASPTYIEALRKGSRSGPAIEVTGSRERAIGHTVAFLIGAVVAAFVVFGMGW
jgi:hypothetical protein